MQSKERKKEYMKEYLQRPEIITKRKEYEKGRMRNPKRIAWKKGYQKKYWEENKDKISKQSKKQSKEYYEKNKERISKRRDEHRSKPRIKERNKIIAIKYRERNEKKIKRREKEYRKRLEVREARKKYWEEYSSRLETKNRKRKYREDNKKHIRGWMNKYNKERRKIDKDYKIRMNLRTRLLQAFKRYSKKGKITTSKKYGINYKAIIEHLKPFPENIENYHIDHIIPLSLFNFNNPKHIKIAFAPENHQWLTVEENLIKKDRLIIPH